MTDHATPRPPADLVGELLDTVRDAQGPRELTRRWRRVVAAIAAATDLTAAERLRLAEELLELGRRLHGTADAYLLAEITGQAVQLTRGDGGHRGLFAHAASSHAGALAVIDDDRSLHWFREAVAVYRQLAAGHAGYRDELDQVLVNTGIVARRAGNRALAAECLDEATTTDASTGRPSSLSPDRLATALTSALHCEIELGRHDRARRRAVRLHDVLDPRSAGAAIRAGTRAAAHQALESFAAHTTPA